MHVILADRVAYVYTKESDQSTIPRLAYRTPGVTTIVGIDSDTQAELFRLTRSECAEYTQWTDPHTFTLKAGFAFVWSDQLTGHPIVIDMA